MQSCTTTQTKRRGALCKRIIQPKDIVTIYHINTESSSINKTKIKKEKLGKGGKVEERQVVKKQIRVYVEYSEERFCSILQIRKAT